MTPTAALILGLYLGYLFGYLVAAFTFNGGSSG